jgi:hypothetical protein
MWHFAEILGSRERRASAMLARRSWRMLPL